MRTRVRRPGLRKHRCRAPGEGGHLRCFTMLVPDSNHQVATGPVVVPWAVLGVVAMVGAMRRASGSSKGLTAERTALASRRGSSESKLGAGGTARFACRSSRRTQFDGKPTGGSRAFLGRVMGESRGRLSGLLPGRVRQGLPLPRAGSPRLRSGGPARLHSSRDDACPAARRRRPGHGSAASRQGPGNARPELPRTRTPPAALRCRDGTRLGGTGRPERALLLGAGGRQRPIRGGPRPLRDPRSE